MDTANLTLQRCSMSRFSAWSNSKLINVMLLITIIALSAMVYTADITLPVICALLAFLSALGYTIWFWVKKPVEIVVNQRLSDIGSYLGLYYIIMVVLMRYSVWFSYVPAIVGVIAAFWTLVKPGDKRAVID